jgi:hypothetical protein
VTRFLLALLWITVLAALIPALDPAGQGGLALVATLAAVSAIATILAVSSRGSILLSRNTFATGPVAAERRLHGAFRRVSSPNTPGRPRPRSALKPGSSVARLFQCSPGVSIGGPSFVGSD